MHVYRNLIFHLKKQLLNYKYVYRDKTFNQICKYSLSSGIDKVLLNNYIQNVQKEYEKIITTSEGGKQLQRLQPIIEILQEQNRVVDLLKNVKELLNDSDIEIKQLAQEEVFQYENKLSEIEENLLEAIVPHDNHTSDAIILEVNAGIGGQEAMLFAREVYEMYSNFCAYKGWSCDVAELDITELGGVRHASIFVNGPGAFQHLRNEAGIHRVQRIPTTEKAGRIHTSTVAVAVLLQPKDVDVKIESKDLRIDTMRASGAGGQHVNTTDSAVRIVHLPTNTAVECQVNRSQIKNREMAMQKLRALLYDKQMNEQIAETLATRKSQVRSNYRNEKIRTYNFNQDRITDHRLQGANVHNLKVFMGGGEQLEDLITKLDEMEKKKQLLEILSNVNNKR